MDKRLGHAYQALSKAVSDLLKDTAQLTDAQLHAPMAQGKWSVAQTIWHVIRAIEKSLDYLDHKMQQNAHFGKAGFKTTIRSLLLNLSLRSDMKFKAPASTADVPEKATREAIQAYAQVQMKRLEQRLDSLPAHLLKREVYKHPRAGRITILQMLRFMHAHTLHHKRQTDKFIASARQMR